MSVVEAAGGDLVLVIGGGGVILVVCLLALRSLLSQVPWLLAALLAIVTVFKADPEAHERCLRMVRRFEPGLKAGRPAKRSRPLDDVAHVP